MAISVSTVEYCNVTTDLIRAYQNIYEIIRSKEVRGFIKTDGYTNVYHLTESGFCSAVFEDGNPLTLKDTIANVNANAGSFLYDGVNDILFIHTTDSEEADAHSLQIGFNKQQFLTECRAIAQGIFESILDKRFPRPLPQARGGITYLGRKYDDDVVSAVAKLTCAVAISSINPEMRNQNNDDDLVSRLRQEAEDIINAHNTGERTFSFEYTPNEIGSAVVKEISVVGDGLLEVSGTFTGTSDKLYRVKITTEGNLTTGKYKLSTDNGLNYSVEEETVSEQWQSIGDGLYIRFDDRGDVFKLNDEWQIMATSKTNTVTGVQLFSKSLIA